MSSILKVTGLTQVFGGLVALSDINMTVEQGEILGVIGPNGAGKTTFFNALTGIIPPTRGKIELMGEDITGIKPHIISSKGFARTFQNIRLFKKMTVLDNVMVGLHNKTHASLLASLLKTRSVRKEEAESEKKALEILQLLDLDDFRYELAGSLPYGLQRRLEIARALATDPLILLLDEPAAGMNEQETEDLLGIIQKLKELGYTIIIIEHDMKFIMNICERLYVFNHGAKIAEGTPEEVKKNAAVIEAYLGKES